MVPALIQRDTLVPALLRVAVEAVGHANDLRRSLSVMAYIMDDRFREPMLPTESYYNGILEGYQQNGLPVSALKKAWEHAVQEVRTVTIFLS